MDYLPIFLKLTHRPCLVVGGGEVAARKVATLCAAGAQVTVLAPVLGESLRARWQAGEIVWREKQFTEEDVEGFVLVVAATANRAVDEAVSVAAQARNILVNVVDGPTLCTFIFPAIIDRSPVIAAVSSGGAAPVLARLLRQRLETLIPPAYGRLAELARRFRDRVRQTLKDGARRRRFWEWILQGPVAQQVFAGCEDEAARLLEEELARQGDKAPRMGSVALVGAGPGDPDLLTLAALRLIQEADVVVYDRLVSPEVMNLVRKDAQKIYAGKQRRQHTMPQAQINRLLADLAKAGKQVVRLKGGDPFIFGRGGEEIETLLEEGVPFQVVPGITAALGCAAYAGIPLTHRDYAQSCVFVTGHVQDGQTIELAWERLALPRQTVVIYMGLQGLEHICASLIAHGCPSDLPAALIQQGTTRHQIVIKGDLRSLPGLVAAREIKPPTLVIIGHVVKLHDKLAWFAGKSAP